MGVGKRNMRQHVVHNTDLNVVAVGQDYEEQDEGRDHEFKIVIHSPSLENETIGTRAG